MDKTSRWVVVGIVADGQEIRINGLNPWILEWRAVGSNPVTLPHPQYPQQMHQMTVYEADDGTRKITFAAAEVSNGAWAFYEPAGRID